VARVTKPGLRWRSTAQRKAIAWYARRCGNASLWFETTGGTLQVRNSEEPLGGPATATDGPPGRFLKGRTETRNPRRSATFAGLRETAFAAP